MHRSESDVSDDQNAAESRDTGGADPGERARGSRRADEDGASTTGVDDNDEFVGRAEGQDVGYAGETGAEAE